MLFAVLSGRGDKVGYAAVMRETADG